MLFKLIVSAALAIVCLGALASSLPADGSPTRVLLLVVVVIACGHHRNVVPLDGAISWMKVHAPSGARVRVIESIWGVPLSRGRSVRVSARAQRFTGESPRLSAFAELWPTPIRAVLRKALVRRNGR